MGNEARKVIVTARPSDAAIVSERMDLKSIFGVFLLIGATGFGGGMAVIALMQKEIVEKRRWISPDEFGHGIALGQMLGPFAVNTAIFVGYQLRGLRGATAALIGFLAPSLTMVIVLSAAYFRWHEIPALQSPLKGLAPVIVALIFSAALTMGKPKIKDALAAAVAVAALAATLLLKVNVLVILAAAALFGVVRCWIDTWRNPEGGKCR